MIRRTRLARISLGDVPKNAQIGRKIPEPNHPDRAFYDPKLERSGDHQTLLGDMNTTFFRRDTKMSPGVAPRRYYVNALSAWFFNELDKGTRSPWCVGVYLLCAALAARKLYRLMYEYADDEREYRAIMGKSVDVISNAPFTESHNLAMGLRNKASSNASGMYIADQSLADPIQDSASFQPPRLIHTEKSQESSTNGSIPADMVIIERREYDKAARRDYVYRMVQYIFADDVDEKVDDAKALKKADRDVAAFQRQKSEWLNNLPLAKRQERARPDHVHGIVKCKGLESNNGNCIPETGDGQSEAVRKILLGLGPTHLLRDASQVYKRNRLTAMKEEITTNLLVMGLRGGEIPAALRHFNNYSVDIVEKDPSLIRIARNFLGFREIDGHKLSLADPLYYLKRHAAEPGHKRYDFVVVDTLDGKGRLSPSYNQLEFVDTVRNVMSEAGVVAVNLPNDDAQYYYQCLQNWRMGFENKLCILAHCRTTQNTVLFAFQDDASKGKTIMGTCGSANEFADVVKTFITHYDDQRRLNFDLLSEIDPYYLRILNPGDKINLKQSLPPNHPAHRDAKYMDKMVAATSGIGGGWVSPTDSRAAYEKGNVGNVRYDDKAKSNPREF